MYTTLKSAVHLTVNFNINPVSEYKVRWYMGSSLLPDANVRDIVTEEHVQTTYFISNITSKQLGNYTCEVINKAITSEPNEVAFNVRLKLRGKKTEVKLYLIWNL